MYEVGKFVQKLDYGQLESIKKLQKEHEIKIEDENDRKTFEYGIFEAEYYHDNNIPFTKYFEQILTIILREELYIIVIQFLDCHLFAF